MEEAVECDGWRPSLVARRDRLHRGDVHEGREAHVRPRRQHPGPIAPFQFQPGRQHAKGNRHHEGERIDASAFKALVKAAVARNGPPAKKR